MRAKPPGLDWDGLEPLPRVKKPATVRRLAPVESTPLAEQVSRLSDEVWRREDGLKRNRFDCFHHTLHIVFRFFASHQDPRRFHSQPGWRMWSRWLLPLMTRAAETYGFAEPVFPKAMLARLAAGWGIDPHVDGGPAVPLVHKVHIPLQTDPEAVLEVDGARFHLAPGYAWEVNNLAVHGVFNRSARDRIHFIFEVFEGAGRDVLDSGAPHA